jgi:hypothetical protein
MSSQLLEDHKNSTACILGMTGVPLLIQEPRNLMVLVPHIDETP